MSLFDHVTPSERIADLVLISRRLRKDTGLESVPFLIVEGRTDEPAWGSLCVLGDRQVFSAGTRALVEQMALLAAVNPPDGCQCAYLVDCDASGKTVHLKHRKDLVVTETCDLEMDFVRLGVARRVVEDFFASEADAEVAVDTAETVALSLSVIRRAAHRARVSMKRDGRQFRLHEISTEIQTKWASDPPTDEDVIAVVVSHLNWSPDDVLAVRAALGAVDRTPEHCVMGKDVLDALFGIARRSGAGEIRGWSVDFFHRRVLGALKTADVTSWVVATRLRAWASETGCELLA